MKQENFKMGPKVDLLVKDELIYELKLRNIELDEKSTVSDLRKILRRTLQQNVPASHTNILGKINVREEIDLISNKITLIEEKADELTNESRTIDIARQNARINHCCTRINSLTHFSLSESEKEECVGITNRYKIVLAKFDELKFDLNALEMSVRKLSESNIEEENFGDVFVEKESKTNVHSLPSNPHPGHPGGSSSLGVSHPVLETCAAPSPPFDPNMYRKLPNPLETYLKNLTVCNGLVTKDLVEFLRILFKVKKETSLSDKQIIEVFVTKTQSPLLDVVLKNKEQNLETLKIEILRYFVPVSVKDDLVKHFVTRPQENNEALPLYIHRVKEYSKLLNCVYTESELVELLIIGLNPKCRINLSLVNKFDTIEDIERACLHSQSVEIKNNLRCSGEGNRKPTMFQINPSNPHCRSPVGRTCFSCGRKGHIARHCYRKTQSKN